MATPKYGYGTDKEYGKAVGYTNKDEEIQRTIDVIKNRESAGMDTTAQRQWFQQLTGSQYNPQPQYDPSAYAKQYQDQINKLYDMQKQSQLAQLQAQRDKAIGEINQQKSQVAPQYQSARNQADAISLQDAQRLRETMAASGLQASGENVTANVAMNNQRLGAINQLNLQERQTMDDFARRIADINNPAEQNALISQLEAERARALLDLGMRADEIGYSRYRDQIGDQRYNQEWQYNIGRDAEMDSRYYDERDYDREWRERQWNELSPAELEKMRLDFEYAQRRAALNRSSSGGGSSSGSSSSSSQQTLNQALEQFRKEQSNAGKTALDKYYEEMEKIYKPIPYKDPVWPIPSPKENQLLDIWERIQLQLSPFR